MLKDRGENRCFTRSLGGVLTWGHSGPGWGAGPTRSRRPRADVGFGIYSSFCWVPSGFRSVVFGVNEAKAGTYSFEIFFSPRKVQEPFRPSCVRNVIERVQDGLSLWGSGASGIFPHPGRPSTARGRSFFPPPLREPHPASRDRPKVCGKPVLPGACTSRRLGALRASPCHRCKRLSHRRLTPRASACRACRPCSS